MSSEFTCEASTGTPEALQALHQRYVAFITALNEETQKVSPNLPSLAITPLDDFCRFWGQLTEVQKARWRSEFERGCQVVAGEERQKFITAFILVTKEPMKKKG